MSNQFLSLCACSFVVSGALFAQSPSGIDLGAIDKSADPCQNFYQYACGTWVKNNPVPADESRWSRFNELDQRNQTILRGILDDSAKNQARSAIDGKIGGFYASCMNEPEIEKLGASPLRAELERISHVGNARELLEETARLHSFQVDVFFKLGPSPDLKNAKMMIADLDQGGLGLPEKDFYFRSDPKSTQIREKYVAAIAKTFVLTGVSPAEARKKAARVMSLETELAKASLDVTSRRDPQKMFHEMPKEQVAKLSPQFQLHRFLYGSENARLLDRQCRCSFLHPSFQRAAEVPPHERDSGLSQLAIPSFELASLAESLCRPELRFLLAHAARNERVEAALETLRARHR